MVKINKNIKNNIRSLAEKGWSLKKMSVQLKIPRSTVAWHAKKLNIKSKDLGGRPKLLTERDENFCLMQMTTGKSKTIVSLEQRTQSKIQNFCKHRHHFKSFEKQRIEVRRKKEKKPLLSQKNIKARLDFARSHEHWTKDDWERVIFSDETKINRFNSDGRTWFWSRDPNTLDERSVQQTVKHGGGGIMMWGCMCSEGVGFACKIDNIMDQYLYKEILEDELLETIEYYELDSKKIFFQHDNDPKHTAKSVKAWLKPKNRNSKQ